MGMRHVVFEINLHLLLLLLLLPELLLLLLLLLLPELLLLLLLLLLLSHRSEFSLHWLLGSNWSELPDDDDDDDDDVEEGKDYAEEEWGLISYLALFCSIPLWYNDDDDDDDDLHTWVSPARQLEQMSSSPPAKLFFIKLIFFSPSLSLLSE